MWLKKCVNGAYVLSGFYIALKLVTKYAAGITRG